MSKKELKDYLREAPGLVGEIARYINDTLDSDQPAIALATAISFVGALKSKRIETKNKLAPNIYTLVVAPSGVGKSRSQRAIAEICKACELSDLLMGRPASDAGMLKRLQSFPRQFLIWDEFGLAFSEMSKSQSGYRTAIIDTMTDLYSASSTLHVGKEYANQERVDVDKPCLSISAASTPSRFFDALNKEFVHDGFLPRWLVFQAPQLTEFKEPEESDVPQSIIDQVLVIEKGEPTKKTGNLAKVLEVDVNHLQVDDILYSVIKKSSQQKILDAKSDIERVLWTRGFENAQKLFMIFADSKNKISDKVAAFCWSLVQFLIAELANKCNNDLNDTRQDKIGSDRALRFLGLIAPGERIIQGQLTKRAANRGFQRSERLARTQDLLESGEWRRVEEQDPDSFRNKVFLLRD